MDSGFPVSPRHRSLDFKYGGHCVISLPKITSASLDENHRHLCSLQRRCSYSWVSVYRECPSLELFFVFWLHKAKQHDTNYWWVQCELQKTKFTQKTKSRNQTILSFFIIRLEPFTCRGKLLISIKFAFFRLFSLSLQNHWHQVIEKW